MIAVRDLLLEDQQKYEQADCEEDDGNEKQKYEAVAEASCYDDNDEEEVEFDVDDLNDGEISPVKKHRKLRKKKRHHASLDITENTHDLNGKEDNDDNESIISVSVNDKDRADEKGACLQDADSKHVSTPQSSGKKRIRKSHQTIEEDSDDEDFLAQTKVLRRTILDDDEEDD